jgi:hypothetical protein
MTVSSDVPEDIGRYCSECTQSSRSHSKADNPASVQQKQQAENRFHVKRSTRDQQEVSAATHPITNY